MTLSKRDALDNVTLWRRDAMDIVTLSQRDALKFDALEPCRAQAPELIRARTWRGQARRDKKRSPLHQVSQAMKSTFNS